MPHPTPARPLQGRTALVTGVSRRRGIGYAVAVELASLGASVFFHHYGPHDADQPWGGDDLDAVRAGVREALVEGAAAGDASAEQLVEQAWALTGRLDILVCNHARSGGDGSVLDMTAEILDAFWDTNTRSTLLLTRHFAHRHVTHGRTTTDVRDAPARPGDRARGDGPVHERTAGRVFWMTSGQGQGPMHGEVAYATSKAALAGATPTVAAELLELGIVLNTINPGPVNTGYLDPESTDRSLEEIEAWREATPFGRWGRPTDPARLIGWLATDQGVWIAGQVITTDGGMGLV
ncbi:SDR family oxidoreductase [Kocuria sediminis]|uniref:SDR family oxidoreductase n=1 Tax=Kocuria sediminis TaxID=1038857 RepID=A0A6N8GKR4_9MICC|nr:SDR family oxidoreductase [Kocuria sediminis]MUN62822.1 SDR family oxidoreductase [Kocuria sediminis]